MGISATEIERAAATLDAGWRAAGIQGLLVTLADAAHSDEHLLAWSPGHLDGAPRVPAVVAVTDRGVVLVPASGELRRVPWPAVDGIASIARPTHALLVSIDAQPPICLERPPVSHLAAVLRSAAMLVGAPTR